MQLRIMLLDWPPVLVRTLAREGRGRSVRVLTHAEVAERAKLSVATVRRISAMQNWDHVKFDVVDRFLTACGFDLSLAYRQRRFVRAALAEGLPHLGHRERILPTATTLAAAAVALPHTQRTEP